MRKQLLSIRRWGVAALAGVTLLGGVLVLGEGAASAATPTVTAAVTTGSSATSLYPTDGTAQAIANLTLTLSAAGAVGDVINLTLPCSSTVVVAASTATGLNWAAAPAKVGCASFNAIAITDSVGAGATSIALTAQTVTTTGAAAGALGFSGTYVPAAGSNTTFTVPTLATVTPFVLALNTPPSIVATTATNATVGNITITEPFLGAIPNGDYVCVTLASSNWGAATPTVSAPPSAGETVVPGPVTGAGTAVLGFKINSAETQATTYTLAGLTVTTAAAAAGPVTATLTVSSAACTPVPVLVVTIGSGTAFAVLTSTQPYQGTTPDQTVADEFMAAYGTVGNANAVISTDADPYDALAASYIEGILKTGLLITSPTSLDANTLLALRIEGVTTVYVVGGPLAVSAPVLATLAATPAYAPGGVTLTGKNIVVVTPSIYGQTADGTAQAINTYFGASPVASVNITAAYTTAGGLYNDTTGSASTTGPAGAAKTAFLISDTDYSDAAALAPVSWLSGIPIILNESTSTGLGAEAAATITALSIKQVIIVGGQLAVPNSVTSAIQALSIPVLRIAGIDATDTTDLIAQFALASGAAFKGLGYTLNAAGAVMLTHSDYWSDALGAAVLGGKGGGAAFIPVLQTETPTTLGSYLTAFLNQAGNTATAPVGINGNLVGSIVALGGTLAIPASTLSAALSAVAAG